MLADFASAWTTAVTLIALASPVLTGIALAKLGVRRRFAALAGLGVLLFVLIGAAAIFFTEIGCWYEDPSAPAAYWWSPRERFCDLSTTWVDRAPLALLLVPSALVVLGAWLWTREHKRLGGTAWALVLTVPLLPGL